MSDDIDDTIARLTAERDALRTRLDEEIATGQERLVEIARVRRERDEARAQLAEARTEANEMYCRLYCAIKWRTAEGEESRHSPGCRERRAHPSSPEAPKETE